MKQITHNANKPKQFASNLKIACILGIISFIVYANSIRNGFAVDDSTLITNNTIVAKGISAIPELIATPYRQGFKNTENDLYRPLSLIMFAAEYQLFDKKPEPMHLVNVLLFAGCVVSLFFFLDNFFSGKRPVVAFICCLLFALHPIHTEVVNNIKSRDELLCFFFAMLALNLFVKYIGSGKVIQLACGAFCFFLSFLSKETVVTFVVLIPLIFFFYKNENTMRSVYVTASAMLVAIAVLIARYAVLSHYHAGDISKNTILDNILAAPGLSFETRTATLILILGHYLKLLFIPYPLIWDYSYNTIPFTHFSDPYVLLSLAAYMFLLFFSIRRLLRNHKDPFAFGILCFLITISLFSNIFFLVGVTLAERFLFLPSVGFCLCAALLIDRLAAKEPRTGIAILRQVKVMAVLIPVCVVCFVIIFNRNSEWVDNYTLYSSDVKKAPGSYRINNLLGDELILKVAEQEPDAALQKQIREEGIAYLEKALSIYPDCMDAENNLGYAYLNNGVYDSAEIHIERAVALHPGDINLVANLAGIYAMNKKYPKAIALFRKLINMNPDDAIPYINLGVCYGNLKMYDSTIYYAKKAITLDPTNQSIYKMLITTYKLAGMPDSVKKYAQIANISLD